MTVIILSTVFSVYLSATSESYSGQASSISQISGGFTNPAENYYDSSVIYKLPDTVKDNNEISLIIQMPTLTLLDAYNNAKTDGSFREYTQTDEAYEVSRDIRDDISSLTARLTQSGLDYTLGGSYDTLLSGFEIKIVASDFEKACKIVGDSANVIVGEVYELMETKLVENDVNIYEGTGIFNSSGFGYDGTGMVIAVLDTGLDYYHNAFSTDTFDADRSKLGLTFEDIEAIIAANNMAAESLHSGLTASDVYISEKVPFGFDYADYDPDVFPLLSDHGTHVSGVIAGNHLDEIVTEDYTGAFVGVAPNAQLVEMKIFSDVESTAHSSWILTALEDCVYLGVDVINMSIGTGCGFSRESDKEAISGVYDKVREQGISLVVAASNSFSSTYGSEKNGNLGLTSNPDTGTVGSPSTYDGALSVASISGTKTPYILYILDGKETIIYFNESTDRFSEEKKFVSELLGEGGGTVSFEYVTIPGAGRTADYSGIDVSGKIALVKRGSTTFEEKANVAEEMGAAGIIIYNNVSGEIKMNMGDTNIPACSISQDDGEYLAEKSSGTIKISSKQTSGPFISDFSSWGPTPDLQIKPEITAHGGSILSSVPGQSYDRISGTSMASPNVAGVTALLRQYVTENFDDICDKTFETEYEKSQEIAAIINRLLMSTADIITNTNGLPYSVRKQGAGLANLTNSAATNAYILVYETVEEGGETKEVAMDKSKIELGDDPDKKGVYELSFSIVNFGDSPITYTLSASVLTEGVSETLTSHGDTTVTEEAYELSGAKFSLVSIDGVKTSGKKVTVPAGSEVKVETKITLSASDKKYLDESFENGMYVEGFIMLETNDDVDLSLPYLAFYGDWTQAPIFDLDYFETNKDELDDSIDVLDKTLPDAYATRPVGGTENDYVNYLGSFYFEQNPNNTLIAADRKYISISNQQDTINSLRYVWAGLLRNCERIEITIVEDSTGKVVYSVTENDVRKSYGDGGSIYAANVDIEFSAIEQNLKNNTAYTVTLKSYLDYGDGGVDTNLKNEFTFPLVTDFSSPTVTDCEFYTEYDRSAKKTRLFATIAVYDNHYSMALLPGYMYATTVNGEATLEFMGFEKYTTPIYSERNSTTYVTYELTDYINEIIQNSCNMNGAGAKALTVLCYDYALNLGAYEIALPDDFTAFYFTEDANNLLDDNGYEYDVALSPYEVYTLDPVVYPATEWSELLTYKSSNSSVVKVVGDKLVALKSGFAEITATGKLANGKTETRSFIVKVLQSGEKGYKKYDKPVLDTFEVTGYYTNKAYYMLDSSARDIGETGTNMKFASTSNLSLSMYPSESVTLQYRLESYFPEDTEIVFSSSNSNRVTVDRNGTIVALNSEGKASVTVKVLMDGKSTYYSKTISIEVKDPCVTSGPSLANYYGTGDAGVVVLPSDLAITEIGQFAFSNYEYVLKGPDEEVSDENPGITKPWYIGDSTIKQITINEGVERIGPYAFAGLTSLETIYLPSTLTTIDYGAFMGCTSLKYIYCSDGTSNGLKGVKFINQAAFQNCALTEINLENAVAIADYSFSYNTSLKKVTFGDDTQSVGAYAFIGDSSLDSLTIKADKIKIGQYALAHCTSLESVSLNSSVIPAGTFYGCTSLSSVTIGKDVNVIGEYAFARNEKLVSFNVASGNTTFTVGGDGKYLLNASGNQLLLVAPGVASLTIDDPSITYIANSALSGNTKITEINIPSVTTVGNYAFAGCRNLTKVNLGTLETIGNYAFASSGVTEFTFYPGVQIGNYAFSGSDIKSVTIPSGTESERVVIPEGAFRDCEKLETVVIGDYVDIGKDAFCNDLDYTVIIEKHDEDLGLYIGYTGYTEAENRRLTSLTIGKNVNIGDGAFLGAAKLESVTLGEGATVGNEAFYNTPSLKSIDLSAVKSIGNNAFSGPISVLSYFYQNEIDGDGYYFYSYYVTENYEYEYRYHAPQITSVDLSSATEIGEYAFAYCDSLTAVSFGDGLTEISDGAFYACPLSSANLGEIEVIGDYAFFESGLVSADLSSAGYIGDYAFAYSAELLSVELASAGGVTLGEGSFNNCINLASIENDGNVTSFGDYSLAYTSISKIDLSSAEYIGTHAFIKDATAPFELAKDENGIVKLSENLADIGENPFAYCDIDALFTLGEEEFNGEMYPTGNLYTFSVSDSIRIIDGSIYKVVPAGLELITWSGDRSAAVAEGTTRISAMAFAGSDVKQVILPTTLISIGHKAFYECNDLSLVTFGSVYAPILEEEYDYMYYGSLENIHATGIYTYVDSHDLVTEISVEGLGISPFYSWYAEQLPTTCFYGANFIDYIGHLDGKQITMIKPVNGVYYDSFVLSQYFDTVIDGSASLEAATIAAIEAISKIPDVKSLRLSDKALVEAARAAYNLVLSYTQRDLVTNYSLLVQAEKRISDLEYLQNNPGASTPTDPVIPPVNEFDWMPILVITASLGALAILALIVIVIVILANRGKSRRRAAKNRTIKVTLRGED